MTKNYVKEHKGKAVPEGATHWREAENGIVDFFMRNSANGPMLVFLSNEWLRRRDHADEDGIKELPNQPALPNWDEAPSKDAVWIEDIEHQKLSFWGLVRNSNIYRCDNDGYVCAEFNDAITIHTRPIEPIAEWVPTVGGTCLGRKFNSDSYEECKVVHIDGDSVLALFNAHHTKGLPPKDPHWCESTNPLKSKEDKEREALLEIVKGHQPVVAGSESFMRFVNEYLDTYAKNIIDAFDIIPKGDL